MQYPFDPKLHEVPVAAFFCLDPRFCKQTIQFIQEELDFREEFNSENFDPYVIPSGPRVLVKDETREIFLNNIERVSIGLHKIKEVILIAHRDCGAYGGSKAFSTPEAERATQEEDLKIARGILKERFPQLAVKLFYLEIIGDKIEFQPVK